VRIRRVTGRVPWWRVYEIALGGEDGSADPTGVVKVRRSIAVRRLESLAHLGVGDAWAEIDEADRLWSRGDSAWVAV
jgi:hypothetical protein